MELAFASENQVKTQFQEEAPPIGISFPLRRVIGKTQFQEEAPPVRISVLFGKQIEMSIPGFDMFVKTESC